MATADDRGPGNRPAAKPGRRRDPKSRPAAAGLYQRPNLRLLAAAAVLVALVAAFLLGQWSAGRGDFRPAARSGQATAAASALDADEASRLEAFLDRYFGSWSAQDMEAYRHCFHPRATVHHIDAAGRVTMQRLDDFIAGQRAGHARSPERMVEVPLWHRVEPGLEAVQVHVRWHLTAGEREVLGRNHFTLQRGGEHGFQIINLVFYGEEASEAES